MVVLFFFIALLVAGLLVFRDFGISWDEEYQWKDNGLLNYSFITGSSADALLQSPDKYHGPAFELFLAGVQKAFHMSDTRSIFLMRHLLTFLIFYCSALFFYALALKVLRSKGLALAGFLMYVLSPHIFSHAFYNSKDPVFLAFFVISMYFLLLFMERKSIRNVLLLAVFSAITIDVRVIGILLPFFFLYLTAAEMIRRRSLLTAENKPMLLFVALFFAVLIPCVILMWPVLWLGPVHHFIEALKENSRFPFEAPILYFGKWYTPTTLPAHYVFFWMFVSRPVLYSLLFVAGLLSLCAMAVRKPAAFLGNTTMHIILMWFFLPLLALLVFNSPVFDTGRHLYFLHGAFVLITLYGLQAVGKALQGRRLLKFFFPVLLALSFIGAIFRMVQLHPYEHLYFNEVASKGLQYQKDNFDFDYWGLAQRNTLERLLEKDTSRTITVWSENLPGQISTYLLKPEQRSRLLCRKDFPAAGYFLADYRWKTADQYPHNEEVCSTVIEGVKLATIFRIRP